MGNSRLSPHVGSSGALGSASSRELEPFGNLQVHCSFCVDPNARGRLPDLFYQLVGDQMPCD